MQGVLSYKLFYLFPQVPISIAFFFSVKLIKGRLAMNTILKQNNTFNQKIWRLISVFKLYGVYRAYLIQKDNQS